MGFPKPPHPDEPKPRPKPPLPPEPPLPPPPHPHAGDSQPQPTNPEPPKPRPQPPFPPEPPLPPPPHPHSAPPKPYPYPPVPPIPPLPPPLDAQRLILVQTLSPAHDVTFLMNTGISSSVNISFGHDGASVGGEAVDSESERRAPYLKPDLHSSAKLPHERPRPRPPPSPPLTPPPVPPPPPPSPKPGKFRSPSMRRRRVSVCSAAHQLSFNGKKQRTRKAAAAYMPPKFVQYVRKLHRRPRPASKPKLGGGSPRFSLQA